MTLLLILYWGAIGALFLYGINCYFLLLVFWKNKKKKLQAIEGQRETGCFPKVTVQLPVYNERYVVARLIECVHGLDYPKDQLEIQILDDSTDDTTAIIEETVSRLRDSGPQLVHVRRKNREGFKAGALEEGMATAHGELIAIFDADFLPERDFLRNTVKYFEDGKLGLVQTRWAHLNQNFSLLTRCQAIAIDGHFTIEQGAREWGGYFLNFNGTAGVWRKSAIVDSGGWQHDTLTEDLDLSYRAQLRGWGVKYLPNVAVPAEIPTHLAAFKSQQRRWAKGSIQTAMKLLPRVWRAPQTLGRKIQASIHLTHYLIHPLMLAVALLSLPVLSMEHGRWSPLGTAIALSLILVGTLSTSSLYVASQYFLYKDWRRRILYIPLLMFVGTGIAISNSIAVWEALRGIRSDFIRTPKWNLPAVGSSFSSRRRYRMRVGPVVLFELLLAAYCGFTLIHVAFSDRFIISPFLFIYAAGFSFVAIFALTETLAALRKEPMS